MAKKKKEAESPAPRYGAIHARVIDAENGMRVLSGVRAVRIKSRNNNLLIMEDYFPALGKIEGSVVFLTEEREVRLENISGFYKHQHNEFTLIIERGEERA